MKTEWIKMSERQPTEADLPAWMHNPKAHDGIDTWLWVAGPVCSYPATHWRPAKGDIPEPPRELTQREKDEEKFHVYMDTRDHGLGDLEIWRAALAYERAEVLKLVNEDAHRDDILNGIRARCTAP